MRSTPEERESEKKRIVEEICRDMVLLLKVVMQSGIDFNKPEHIKKVDHVLNVTSMMKKHFYYKSQCRQLRTQLARLLGFHIQLHDLEKQCGHFPKRLRHWWHKGKMKILSDTIATMEKILDLGYSTTWEISTDHGIEIHPSRTHVSHYCDPFDEMRTSKNGAE